MTADHRTYSPLWQRLTIAVVGGDEREQEICRLAAESGAAVKAFGFPWPSGGIGACSPCSGCCAGVGRRQYRADAHPRHRYGWQHLRHDPDHSRGSRYCAKWRPAHTSSLDERTTDSTQAAAGLGVSIHEYEGDHELMLLRAPAIVEGVIKVLIENTPITIHDARICVVGQGNIGTVLTRTLIALGAHVTVAARNPIQRASAYTMGAAPLPLENLPHVAGSFDVLVSTVPAPLVTSTLIDRLPPMLWSSTWRRRREAVMSRDS